MIKKTLSHLDKIDYLLEQELIACPLCSSESYRLVESMKERRGFVITVVLCNKCGHIYLNPRPKLSSYKEFYYNSDYRAYLSGSFSAQEENKVRWEKLNDFRYHQKRIGHGHRLYQEYMKTRICPNDLVFDIGCGDGAWLIGLKEMTNCRITGCDADMFYREYIKKQAGITIEVGMVEEIMEKISNNYKGQVKLVIASGSLNHMLDPLRCLRLVHNMLTPDGYLYICNKNLFRHELFYHYMGINEYASIDHAHYFFNSTYKFMVESAGFKIITFSHDSKIRFLCMDILAQKNEHYKKPEPKIYPDKIYRALKLAKRFRWIRVLPKKLQRLITQKISL